MTIGIACAILRPVPAVIGITGFMGSGKGEIVRMMRGRGYSALSLSDIVREETGKRGLPLTREHLQNVGNMLREDLGAGALGRKVRERIETTGDERNVPAHRSSDPVSAGEERRWVVDGIRNPAEILELRMLPGFQLIGVHAGVETLVERISLRAREGEALTREAILAKLDREKGTLEPAWGQQVQQCLADADYLILNEGSLGELEGKLEHFLRLLSGEDRPGFHEIFMEIACAWAKRATCLRRKVGAVITKDSQQLTAGYNGAPRGVPHCAQLGGCLRQKLGIPSGQRHEICRGTHAEQNAITQAAKFGISIEGSTLYCNCFPCVICTKMILNAGITTVVYDSDYDDPLSKEILGQQNVLKIVRYEGRRFRRDCAGH